MQKKLEDNRSTLQSMEGKSPIELGKDNLRMLREAKQTEKCLTQELEMVNSRRWKKTNKFKMLKSKLRCGIKIDVFTCYLKWKLWIS